MIENTIKTRDKSKKRKMIIEGATKAFMDHGYKNASMDVIASYASVSKKTIYNHFKSKENVILSIITEYLDGKAALKDIIYDKLESIENQLLSFLNAELYLVNTPEKLGLAKVLTSTFIEDPILAYRIVAKFEPNRLKFIHWLEDAIVDNKLVVDDLDRAATIFYGMIEGAITYPVLFQKELNAKYSTIVMEDIVTTFLCRYKNNVQSKKFF